ncbi:hypothetical protein [Catellatospora chokoriensis]|uniref:Uncharacterized protein n=1 Tax=Catellatospora chokoriensis TaxID=310353 RepID=A0A8J3K534_9ACTN|nr:hypothetical protein [Catellatospora chokoriensis]GIF93083.1 hypothetical protein Cch02nite_65270 [Catellatospora chokoriensis]
MSSPHAEYPELSRRANGDRLIGVAGPLAEEMYAAGTPPVHGLAAKPTPAAWITDVRIGDRLRIRHVDGRWVVYGDAGELGHLRWHPSDDGRLHATTGSLVTLPRSGVLHVQRLVVDKMGTVKDLGGYVQPD